MFEHLPIEMRNMSAISSVLFSCFGAAVGYLYFKYGQLEDDAIDNSVDIERLNGAVENTEKLVESLKEEYLKTIGWVREDNAANYNRIDNSLKEIQKRLYKGG